MFYTYVLKRLKDGKLYIGSTSNLERRIKEHNSGKSISTRNRKPFALIYYEEHKTLSEARFREYRFKRSRDVLRRAMEVVSKSK